MLRKFLFKRSSRSDTYQAGEKIDDKCEEKGNKQEQSGSEVEIDTVKTVKIATKCEERKFIRPERSSSFNTFGYLEKSSTLPTKGRIIEERFYGQTEVYRSPNLCDFQGGPSKNVPKKKFESKIYISYDLHWNLL